MNALQRIAGGAATAFAVFALAAPAFAGGSIKDKPEPRRCTLSANVGLTTDYVFRGISQSDAAPAVQGGFDATCGMFYAGVWASAIDFGSIGLVAGDSVAHLEVDFYGGVKFTTGKIAWDAGIIYYAYPNAIDNGLGNAGLGELNMVEFKLGASGEIWKGGTLGVTAFYSPDYTGELGAAWTFEGSFSQVLPKVSIFTPTFSALYGYQKGDKAIYNTAFGDDNYSYWNAGITFAFLEKWSLDVRYWDSNLPSGGTIPACGPGLFQCDERVVGTLKFTY